MATVTFYGSGISFLSETNSDQGNIAVGLDGASKGTVDGYSASRSSQQIRYQVSGLAVGVRTLSLTKESGTYFLVDRFDVH